MSAAASDAQTANMASKSNREETVLKDAVHTIMNNTTSGNSSSGSDEQGNSNDTRNDSDETTNGTSVGSSASSSRDKETKVENKTAKDMQSATNNTDQLKDTSPVKQLKITLLDLDKWKLTYVRTRNNSLRCFPGCRPVHKERSFCGLPVVVAVEAVEEMQAKQMVFLGSFRKARSDVIQIGEKFSTVELTKMLGSDFIIGRFASYDTKTKRATFKLGPPRKWRYVANTLSSTEMHTFTVYGFTQAGGRCVARQDSPLFTIVPAWRQTASEAARSDLDGRSSNGYNSTTYSSENVASSPASYVQSQMMSVYGPNTLFSHYGGNRMKREQIPSNAFKPGRKRARQGETRSSNVRPQMLAARPNMVEPTRLPPPWNGSYSDRPAAMWHGGVPFPYGYPYNGGLPPRHNPGPSRSYYAGADGGGGDRREADGAQSTSSEGSSETRSDESHWNYRNNFMYEQQPDMHQMFDWYQHPPGYPVAGGARAPFHHPYGLYGSPSSFPGQMYSSSNSNKYENGSHRRRRE